MERRAGAGEGRFRATSVKIAAALPGTSGTPTTVILASLRSWATPAMMACSMVLPSVGSSTTHVPSSWENEERTWIGMLWRRP